MADVYAVFGTLLALGIAFPGLLTGSWLLFPDMVGRARIRAAGTPWRSFLLGVGAVLLTAIPVLILNALPIGIAKLAAVLIVFAPSAWRRWARPRSRRRWGTDCEHTRRPR